MGRSFRTFRNRYLSGVNFSSQDLRGADFSYANLDGANFTNANLRGAVFLESRLYDADFKGANLLGTDFSRAQLTGVLNFSPQKAKSMLIVPPRGDIIVYKKCHYDYIVTLLIPDGVRRHNATGRKCRAEAAVVIDIENAWNEPQSSALSLYDKTFTYRLLDWVEPRGSFSTNRWVECASGIHFFMTKQEARDFIF